MPKRSRSYRKRPRSAKRRRRSTRRRRNTALSVQRQPGFSNQQVVFMRYVTTVSINPNIGATAEHQFRANSIFDPDYTGVGHQPMGRDEWATFYDHYTVLGCSIRATFISQGNANNQNVFVGGILLDDDSGLISNISTVLEQGKSHYRLIGNSDSGHSIKTVSHYYNPRRFFGVKDLKDNRDMLGAQMSANPSENCHFKVFVGSPDATDDVAPQDVLVTLVYKCLLTEPKNLLTS